MLEIERIKDKNQRRTELITNKERVVAGLLDWTVEELEIMYRKTRQLMSINSGLC